MTRADSAILTPTRAQAEAGVTIGFAATREYDTAAIAARFIDFYLIIYLILRIQCLRHSEMLRTLQPSILLNISFTLSFAQVESALIL